MTLRHVNFALTALLVITTGLAFTMKVDHSQPNIEFLPDMKRSLASAAFASTTVFSNGRTLQQPVAGTIARGQLPLHYAATKEDAERAGRELINPYHAEDETRTEQPAGELESTGGPGDSVNSDDGQAPESRTPDPTARLNASIERGTRLYGVYCVSCHGSAGLGDGPVAKRGFPPPPPLTTGKSFQMPDGQLFHILTYGQGSMASMAGQLDRAARWDVINFVRSLQESTQQTASSAERSVSEPDSPGTSAANAPEELRP